MALDDVAEGCQVLDVDGGEDVDAGVEQFLDVLPALGVDGCRGCSSARIRRRSRCAGLRARTASRSISSNSVSRYASAVRRDDFQSVQQGTGVAAAVVQGERDDHVLAASGQPVGLFEHGVGLADPRCCPEENAQRCPCHVVILSLGRCTAAATSRFSSVTFTDGCPRKASSPVLVRRSTMAWTASGLSPWRRGHPGHLEPGVGRGDVRVQPGAAGRHGVGGDVGFADAFCRGDGGTGWR